MERFKSACEALIPVQIAPLVDWIEAIDFKDMPQRHNLGDGKAVIVDPEWERFYERTDAVVKRILALFPQCKSKARMLVVVMPGHSIKPHADPQSPDWRARVHVPLVSNDKSKFIVGGEAYQLKPGTAYCVNPEIQHSVVNDGDTRRIHFIFDVVE